MPLKLLFAVMRRFRPIAVFGELVVLTKRDDVCEVLNRFDDFMLGEVIEPGMPWGPFLMTVDWREQHRRERSVLESAVDPVADVATIKRMAAKRGRTLVDVCAKKEKNRIDVITELAEPLVMKVAKSYFGLPPLNGNMARVMRNLAGIIMVNPPVGSQQWAESRQDMTMLTSELIKRIAATKPGRQPGSSLLARLVTLRHVSPPYPWFDDDWIRRYLTGLVGTGGATIVRAFAHTVDQLVARPQALERARKLAADIDRSEEAPDRPGSQAELNRLYSEFRGIIYEALRFRPMLPLLLRSCPRDTVIASGSKRVRRILAGSRILAPPLAAMFDPTAFPSPWRFEDSRPLGGYIHFGVGERNCFGRYIADIVIIEALRALLTLPDLKRASGPDGRIRYEGPVPRRLVLTFQVDSRQP